MSDIDEAVRNGWLHKDAEDEIKRLRKLDSEAATYVESVICLRTHFTGDPPYVGWKGLGLALTEALDDRDHLRKLIADHNAGCQSRCGIGEQEAVACGYRPYFKRNGRRCPSCPCYEIIDIEAKA